MNLKDIMDEDLQAIADDFENVTITWKGEDYECIPSSAGADLTLEIGGFGGNADIAFTIRTSLFTDDILPVSKEILTFDSINYRIQHVSNNGNGAFIRLLCSDDSKGV